MALNSPTNNALESALANPQAAREVRNVLNVLNSGLADAEFTVGAEAANVINVAIQLKDPQGGDLAQRTAVIILLLADANGDALNTIDLDTIAIGTDGVVAELLADKVLLAVSEADGDIDINLTEATATGTLYMAVVLPDGRMAISGAITFA